MKQKVSPHKVLEFMTATDVSAVIAVYYLQEADNNLKKALENYHTTNPIIEALKGDPQ